MKPILHFSFAYLLICLTFSSCSNGNQSQTTSIDTITAGRPHKGVIWDKKNIVQIPLTLEENNMKGSIRSVTYSSYKFIKDSGQWKKILEAKGYNVYNKAGFLINQDEYLPDGQPRWKCVYKYDENNNSTEWHFKFFDTNDEYVTNFKYDKNGNNIEQVVTNTDPARSEVVLLRYDNMGNELQEITLDAGGMMKRATISNYDDIGDQTMYINLSAKGDTTFQLTASYDGNGYKTGGSVYIDGKKVSRWQQRNDSNGRMMEKYEFDARNKMIRKTLQKHDSLGNLLETITYKPDGTIDTTAWNARFEYRYDAKGNIISEVSYLVKNSGTEPANATESQYTYYQ